MGNYSARPTALPSLGDAGYVSIVAAQPRGGLIHRPRNFCDLTKIRPGARDLVTVPSIIALAVPGLIAIVFGVVAVAGALLSSKPFAEPGAFGTFFTPAFLTGMGFAV